VNQETVPSQAEAFGNGGRVITDAGNEAQTGDADGRGHEG